MKIYVRRGVGIAAAIAVVAGIGLAVTWARGASPEAAKYRTTLITAGPIARVVLASGTLQPVAAVSVGTQVSGTVMERKADFNDHVRKGQVLLRLDPMVLQARLRQARAQFASAEASLALAEATLKRNRNLSAQGYISEVAFQQSRREYDAAQANVESARAQVDAAQTDLENSVIRSPVDGIVIRRNIDVGQTVAASFQTPDLFQLATDLRRLLIHVSVSEQDVGLVREGQEVRFSVDAYPDREFQGTVTQVRLNSSSNQGVVSYTVTVDVDNHEELLKPGMTAQTRIVVASKPRVLRIPTAALRFRPDNEESTTASGPAVPDAQDDGALGSVRVGARMYRVYTVGERQKPMPHEVSTGISNQRFAELVGGDLKEGDAVIVQLAPQPGARR